MSRAEGRQKGEKKLTFRSINWIQEWPLIGSHFGVIISCCCAPRLRVFIGLTYPIEIQHVRIESPRWISSKWLSLKKLKHFNKIKQASKQLKLFLLPMVELEEAIIHSIQITFRTQHICQFKIHKMHSHWHLSEALFAFAEFNEGFHKRLRWCVPKSDSRYSF